VSFIADVGINTCVVLTSFYKARAGGPGGSSLRMIYDYIYIIIIFPYPFWLKPSRIRPPPPTSFGLANWGGTCRGALRRQPLAFEHSNGWMLEGMCDSARCASCLLRSWRASSPAATGVALDVREPFIPPLGFQHSSSCAVEGIVSVAIRCASGLL